VTDSAKKAGFFSSLRDYWQPGVREMLFLGFASGLPLPMVLMTLSARLRLDGIDRTTIGLFSLVGLAYSMKFLWSPIVDRVRLPALGALGQRRSWILLGQLGVIVGLIAMALHEPNAGVQQFAMIAAATAFFSATQDIAVDAYRIESVDYSLQGTAAAAYQVGYQVALICSQAGVLVMASRSGWTLAYLMIALLMLVGLATTMRVEEPARHAIAGIKPDPSLIEATAERLRPLALVVALLATAILWLALRGPLAAKGDSTLALDVTFGSIGVLLFALLMVLRLHALRGARDTLVVAVVLPVRDIVLRFGWRLTIPMLALIVTYRLNYTAMGVAANTFYVDMHYTLDQIALVSKTYGVALTLFGAVWAGWFVRRIGFMRSLLLGVLLLSAANLLYAHVGTLAGEAAPGIWWLAAVISLDNIANGIAGTAFIAYMSSLTSKEYTATQYALFGTLWSLPAKTIASQWGRIVDAFGYPAFFVYTAVIALPAVLLILWLMRTDAAPNRGTAPARDAA
jgi:PAT family beta-lactamase induction signal transducer AmpG